MRGMDATTGRTVDGLDHIRQSVGDILTTPIGSRVMRRDYGSLLPELLDYPLNEGNLLRVYSAAVMAVIRWEPRIRVQTVRRLVDNTQPGRAVLSIESITDEGADTTLEVPVT